jgi:hypothetical protein
MEADMNGYMKDVMEEDEESGRNGGIQKWNCRKRV